ncbi:unnamed protein product, partial [Choristocarpus tenellus]
ATVIWNLSKRQDNAMRLVERDTFASLFNRLCQEDEEDDVICRVISCIQNLASRRRCAPGLTDHIASNRPMSEFLGTLFSCITNQGRKNMHQRVMGTFANLAYICVSDGTHAEWAVQLR